MAGQSVAAVVLAAGKGTRMKSERAKVLHPVCGRPLAYWPIRAALEAGAAKVVVVVGHQASEVRAALTEAFPSGRLVFAVQKEQRGTAHAVRCARAALAGHAGEILILCGDAPLVQAETLLRLRTEKARAVAALSLLTMRLPDPTGYGRVVRDGAGRPARIVEEKDADPATRKIDEANAGFYCVDATFLWSALAKVKPLNAQRELYLTDLLALAVDEEQGAVAVETEAAEAAGVNDHVELSRVARILNRRIAHALMRAGVAIEDPERVDLDEGVAVGAETVIEPGVRLRGKTRIGSGVVVGQGSVLTDARIADGVVIRPYTVVDDATVGRGAIVGPFARLRPGTELAEETHVGNFVETKKTRLGKGSKANHLSYLGDAVIGAGVNVGAGTITCNYDGEKKHVTTLGDGVFVGSDTTLVAPVSVGKGAYIGAGSCITENVPAGALALGRGRQVVKRGWVAKRKKGR
jgi:bifunctional UDP-N-acetylglucosamine pyrophosphorylase/glucosamine-1-phosphate N-acetyltransferase